MNILSQLKLISEDYNSDRIKQLKSLIHDELTNITDVKDLELVGYWILTNYYDLDPYSSEENAEELDKLNKDFSKEEVDADFEENPMSVKDIEDLIDYIVEINSEDSGAIGVNNAVAILENILMYLQNKYYIPAYYGYDYGFYDRLHRPDDRGHNIPHNPQNIPHGNDIGVNNFNDNPDGGFQNTPNPDLDNSSDAGIDLGGEFGDGGGMSETVSAYTPMSKVNQKNRKLVKNSKMDLKRNAVARYLRNVRNRPKKIVYRLINTVHKRIQSTLRRSRIKRGILKVKKRLLV